MVQIFRWNTRLKCAGLHQITSELEELHYSCSCSGLTVNQSGLSFQQRKNSWRPRPPNQHQMDLLKMLVSVCLGFTGISQSLSIWTVVWQQVWFPLNPILHHVQSRSLTDTVWKRILNQSPTACKTGRLDIKSWMWNIFHESLMMVDSTSVKKCELCLSSRPGCWYQTPKWSFSQTLLWDTDLFFYRSLYFAKPLKY